MMVNALAQTTIDGLSMVVNGFANGHQSSVCASALTTIDGAIDEFINGSSLTTTINGASM